MPKPFSHLTGNGCHFHISLWDPSGETQPVRRRRRHARLRPLGAGVPVHGRRARAHARAASAIVAPTVNSYKRIGVGAPTLGRDVVAGLRGLGRQQPHPDDPRAGRPRFEHRGVDGSANPYLAATALLASGLDGVEQGPRSGRGEHRATCTRRRSTRYARRGIEPLPATLLEACGELERDDVLRDWFGHTGSEHYVDYFAQVKREEFGAYHAERLGLGGRPVPDAVLVQCTGAACC